MKEKVYLCECAYSDHQFIVRLDEDNDPDWNVFISVCLVKSSFWKRISIAFKYLFNLERHHSHFDEITLSKERKEDLIKFLQS